MNKLRYDANVKLLEAINEMVPLLNAYIEENGFKIKANGVELFEKDRKALYNIIAPIQKKYGLHRVGTEVRGYSSRWLTLNLSISFKVGDFGCAYINSSAYLFDRERSDIVLRQDTVFKPRDIYSFDECKTELEWIKAEDDAIRERISRLRQKLVKYGNFIGYDLQRF